jgi:hypothetical protein
MLFNRKFVCADALPCWRCSPAPRLGAAESLIARHRNFQRQTKNNLSISLRNLREVTCFRDSGDFVFLLAA